MNQLLRMPPVDLRFMTVVASLILLVALPLSAQTAAREGGSGPTAMSVPAPQVTVSPGLVTTVAGTGTAGDGGDGGPATSAKIFYPEAVTTDASGNLYIADTTNSRVRKVSATTGIITTVAGIGTCAHSGDGGPATSAGLCAPTQVALDAAGDMYIADSYNNCARLVRASTGVISTIAGNGSKGYSGDGGPATHAELNYPEGIAVDAAGNIYIADTLNQTIRKVIAATGAITTWTGNGTQGYGGDGGPATSAELNWPGTIALDNAGNLYIPDYYNNRIRKVTASTGVITTVAGTGIGGYNGDGGLATNEELYEPFGVAVDAGGDIIIADTNNQLIRKVSAATGVITSVAGSPDLYGYGGDGSPATSAEFYLPSGIAIDGAGNVLVADAYNQRIRKISASAAPLNFPQTLVGSSSAAQSISVSNIGNAPLDFGGIAASANFSVAADITTCSTSETLQPGASCVVGVSFIPEASGTLAGTLTLTDNAQNLGGSTQQIQLAGTGLTSTTTTLTASPNPSTGGQTVSFTATVTASNGKWPSGLVTFYNGTTAIGTLGLSQPGVAVLKYATLPVGTHAMTAIYEGSSTLPGSTSLPVPQTVAAESTTTTLTTSPNPSTTGQTVTLTASVTAGNGVTPIGTVSFLDGATLIANVSLSSGSAKLNHGFNSSGTHSLTAKYDGSNYMIQSASPAVAQVVNP